MDELEQEYDFNLPLEVTEVFRAASTQLRKALTNLDEEPAVVEETIGEYSSKTSFGWEEIRMIREYPYPDDWKIHKGPKCFVTLHGYPNDLLILGKYSELRKAWVALRKKYPLFRVPDEGYGDGGY